MLDIEFNVLHAVASSKGAANDIALTVGDDLFISEDAHVLAKTFISYIKTFRSIPSKRVVVERVADEPSKIELVEKFFAKIENQKYNPDDYNFDLSKLKNAYKDYIVKNLKNSIIKSEEDPASITRSIQREINKIKDIDHKKSYSRKTVREYVPEFTNNYIEKYKNPELGCGIKTGYSFLDYVKNGIAPNDLVIIGGESGAGKSFFMNNIAIQMWMQQNTVFTNKNNYSKGYNVAYFSLEMSQDDCFRRTMSRVAEVPTYGLRDATLSKSEAEGVRQGCKFMRDYPYEFDIIDVPRGFTVEQMEMTIDEIKSYYTPDVIFVDYMGLMEDMDDEEQDWLKLGNLAGKLHEFTRVYSIPIVSAVQLNRSDPNKKNERTIGMHRIGRSNLIATHATLILQIEKRPDEESHDDFVYHVVKNRHGESGKYHSLLKDFARGSLIDQPYDVETAENWSSSDVLVNVSDILGSLDD